MFYINSKRGPHSPTYENHAIGPSSFASLLRAPSPPSRPPLLLAPRHPCTPPPCDCRTTLSSVAAVAESHPPHRECLSLSTPRPPLVLSGCDRYPPSLPPSLPRVVLTRGTDGPSIVVDSYRASSICSDSEQRIIWVSRWESCRGGAASGAALEEVREQLTGKMVCFV